MKKFNSFVVTLLLCLLLPAAAQAEFNELSNLSEEKNIEKMISESFLSMSARYSVFARLFNLCQKQPNHSDCGDKYTEKRSKYEVVKANHNVLTMVNSSEFKSLPMPEINYPEVISSLQTLGYLEADIAETISNESVLVAVNSWQHANNILISDQIYFLHALLIRSQVLAQELAKEEDI